MFALTIMKAGESFFENPMETPFIPTWSRVNSAIPDFLERFKRTVEADNKKLFESTDSLIGRIIEVLISFKDFHLFS